MTCTKILKNIIQKKNITNRFWKHIVDILSNKKLYPIVRELFIRGSKLNISLVFITQSCFALPQNIRLNSAHYFIIKIQNKWELQQFAFNHSSDTDFQRPYESLQKMYCKTIFIFSNW